MTREKAKKKDGALSVAICVLVEEKRVMFVHRKGNFEGLLALPGGKIHIDEHALDAVVREIKEETGYEIGKVAHLGTVSELYASQKGMQHFLLQVFSAAARKHHGHAEFEPVWVALQDLEKRRASIIPSDYLMVTRMYLKKESGYFDCEMREIKGKGIVLKKFEKLEHA